MKKSMVKMASAVVAAVGSLLFSSASFAEDLTSSLEFVDNPTYREWNSNITLTGIADLQFYRGKLFPGVGEVELNPGPVPVYSIDPYTKLSVKEFTAGTEQLSRFRIASWGEMFVGSEDPHEGSVNEGDVFVRDADANWRFYKSFKGSMPYPSGTSSVLYDTHVWSIVEFDGACFLSGYGLGRSTNRFVSVEDVSGRNGSGYVNNRWAGNPLRREDVYLVYPNNLFVIPRGPIAGVKMDNQNGHFEVGHYDKTSGQFVLSHQHVNTLWPGVASTDYELGRGTTAPSSSTDFRVYKPTSYKDRVVYILSFDTLAGNLRATAYPIPVAGYTSVDDSGSISATRISFGGDNKNYPFDFTIDNGILYALTSKYMTSAEPDKKAHHIVWKSTDGVNFTEVLSFDYCENMISLEYHDGYFYFGVGCANYAPGFSYSNANNAGSVYRIRCPQEPVQIETSVSELELSRGGSAAMTVKLSAQPSETTVVKLAPMGAVNGLTTDHETLTFTTANWNTPQSVQVSIAADAGVGAGNVTLLCGVSGDDVVHGEFGSSGVTSAEVGVKIAASGEPSVPHEHVWSPWVTNAPPTETHEGVRSRSCIAAGCSTPVVTETETIPMLGAPAPISTPTAIPDGRAVYDVELYITSTFKELDEYSNWPLEMNFLLGETIYGHRKSVEKINDYWTKITYRCAMDIGAMIAYSKTSAYTDPTVHQSKLYLLDRAVNTGNTVDVASWTSGNVAFDFSGVTTVEGFVDIIAENFICKPMSTESTLAGNTYSIEMPSKSIVINEMRFKYVSAIPAAPSGESLYEVAVTFHTEPTPEVGKLQIQYQDDIVFDFKNMKVSDDGRTFSMKTKLDIADLIAKNNAHTTAYQPKVVVNGSTRLMTGSNIVPKQIAGNTPYDLANTIEQSFLFRDSTGASRFVGFTIKPTEADPEPETVYTDIHNAAEFKAAMAAGDYGAYRLMNSIDLAGSGYVSAPVFKGTFNGNGKTITGLGAQPLCVTNQGEIASLEIDGAGAERLGTGIGVMCDTLDGGTFTNCVVKGYTLKHTVADQAKGNGLFAGEVKNGSRIIGCTTAADCTVTENSVNYAYVGGFVGLATLTEVGNTFEVIDSTNKASVIETGNTTWNRSGAAGFVGRLGGGAKGGAAVHFVRCVNLGTVTSTGNNGTDCIGGFVGFANGAWDSQVKVLIEDSFNRGDIVDSGTADSTGGFVGALNYCVIVDIERSANYASVGSAKTVYAGGLVGYACQPDQANSFKILNSANYGAITGKTVGGLVANHNTAGWGSGTDQFLNSANYGTLTGSAAVGQILGTATTTAASPTLTIKIDNCWTLDSTLTGATVGEVTKTNNKDASVADNTALVALNSIAGSNADYGVWHIGETTHPELTFAKPATSEDPEDPVDPPEEEECNLGTLERVQVYTEPGNYTFTVPLNIDGAAKILVVGGGVVNGAGGEGISNNAFTMAPGSVWNVTVGAAGQDSSLTLSPTSVIGSGGQGDAKGVTSDISGYTRTYGASGSNGAVIIRWSYTPEIDDGDEKTFAVTLTPDRTNGLYLPNETVTYTFGGTVDDGPIPDGQKFRVTWSAGKEQLSEAEYVYHVADPTISFVVTKAANYRLRAMPLQPNGDDGVQSWYAPQCGVVCDFDNITKPMGDFLPSDFDEWWEGELAAQREKTFVEGHLDMSKVVMTPYDFQGCSEAQKNTYLGREWWVNAFNATDNYDVRIPALGTNWVAGGLSMPKDTSKKYPAIINFYGVGWDGVCYCDPNGANSNQAIEFYVNAHGLPEGANWDEDYQNMRAAIENIAKSQGWNTNYELIGKGQGRDNVYYRHVFLRAAQAVEFIKQLPQWDGKTLIVNGRSQGSAQSVAAAALAEGVTHLYLGISAMCDFTGEANDPKRPESWPFNTRASVHPESDYFDCVNFAHRITGKKVSMIFGLTDDLCPATGPISLYNALKGNNTTDYKSVAAKGHDGAWAQGELNPRANAVLKGTADPGWQKDEEEDPVTPGGDDPEEDEPGDSTVIPSGLAEYDLTLTFSRSFTNFTQYGKWPMIFDTKLGAKLYGQRMSVSADGTAVVYRVTADLASMIEYSKGETYASANKQMKIFLLPNTLYPSGNSELDIASWTSVNAAIDFTGVETVGGFGDAIMTKFGGDKGKMNTTTSLSDGNGGRIYYSVGDLDPVLRLTDLDFDFVKAVPAAPNTTTNYEVSVTFNNAPDETITEIKIQYQSDIAFDLVNPVASADGCTYTSVLPLNIAELIVMNNDHTDKYQTKLYINGSATALCTGSLIAAPQIAGNTAFDLADAVEGRIRYLPKTADAPYRFVGFSIHPTEAAPVDPPEEPEEHTHVWGEWTTNSVPTCTTTGLRTHTCTAEGCTTPAAKEEEIIAALGHIEVIDPAVPATTTSTGLTEGKHCSRCGAVLVERQVIPMLDPENPGDDSDAIRNGFAYYDITISMKSAFPDFEVNGDWPMVMDLLLGQTIIGLRTEVSADNKSVTFRAAMDVGAMIEYSKRDDYTSRGVFQSKMYFAYGASDIYNLGNGGASITSLNAKFDFSTVDSLTKFVAAINEKFSGKTVAGVSSGDAIAFDKVEIVYVKESPVAASGAKDYTVTLSFNHPLSELGYATVTRLELDVPNLTTITIDNPTQNGGRYTATVNFDAAALIAQINGETYRASDNAKRRIYATGTDADGNAKSRANVADASLGLVPEIAGDTLYDLSYALFYGGFKLPYRNSGAAARVTDFSIELEGSEPDDPPVVEHTHAWGEWYTNVVPTVEHEGELRRDCIASGCTDPVAYETQELPKLEPEEPPEEPEEPVSPTIDPFAADTLTNCVYQVGETDRVYFFAEVGEHSFTVPSGFNATAKVLVVGGGGAGGGTNGGGGGGGQVVYNEAMTLTAGETYTVTVGAGGIADPKKWTGGNGGDSSFGSVSAIGGGAGGGGSLLAVGKDGGNGGGAGGNSNELVEGGKGAEGGFSGGTRLANYWGASGGGGAAERGHDGYDHYGIQDVPYMGCGGKGRVIDITGSSVMYAPGGGGTSSGKKWTDTDGSKRYSGLGGGDDGYGNADNNTDAATPGRDGVGGGGGGGAWGGGSPGANGGSGVVIIRLTKSIDPPKPKSGFIMIVL